MRINLSTVFSTFDCDQLRKSDTSRKNTLKPVKLPSFKDAYYSAFSRRRFGTAKTGSMKRHGKLVEGLQRICPTTQRALRKSKEKGMETDRARKDTFPIFQGLPLSAKKSLESISFLVLPQHE